jgi:serine/threonine protein kinase
VKIGDFGISKRIKAGDSTELRTATGAIGYEAPEIRGFIDDEVNCESSVYTNLVDIWSFGCVIYKIMAKELPFQSSRDLRRFCEKRISFPSPPLEDKMSQEGIEFLRRILEPSPLNRPSAVKALQYEWLKLEEIPENVVFDALRMPAPPQAESNPQQPVDIAVPNNTDGQSPTLLNLAAPSPPLKATSPMKVEEQTCRVLYNFDGQGENELSLRKGEIVIVVQKESRGKQRCLSICIISFQLLTKSAGWWLVKRRVNDGWAPSDYLKEEKKQPKTASPTKAEKRTCRVLYDFDGQDENELSLRKGEIVIVVQKENRGKQRHLSI